MGKDLELSDAREQLWNSKAAAAQRNVAELETAAAAQEAQLLAGQKAVQDAQARLVDAQRKGGELEAESAVSQTQLLQARKEAEDAQAELGEAQRKGKELETVAAASQAQLLQARKAAESAQAKLTKLQRKIDHEEGPLYLNKINPQDVGLGQCVICLDTVKLDQIVILGECSHVMCRKDLAALYKEGVEGVECPCCRQLRRDFSSLVHVTDTFPADGEGREKCLRVLRGEASNL